MTSLVDYIKENSSKTRFIDLPLVAKKSLIQYMAIDGCAWSAAANLLNEKYDELKQIPWDELITLSDKEYADKEFHFMDVPTEIVTGFLMSCSGDFAEDFDSFEDYHKEFLAGGGIPDYGSAEQWPAIAWCDEEVLIDGWKRFHSYYRDGNKTISIIV